MNTGGHRPITRSMTRASRSQPNNNIQQLPTVTRSRRGRKPTNASVRFENIQQVEHAAQVNEQPAEENRVEDMSAEPYIISTEEQPEPETINVTTSPERVPRQSVVVENNISADQASDNNQRINDRILRENPGRLNQVLLIQLETNEVPARTDTGEAPISSGKKRKVDAENDDLEAKRVKKKKKPKKFGKNGKAKEKRKARIKTICSKKIQIRIERAETQKMYLISRTIVSQFQQNFIIMGPTGIVYTVVISHVPNCTCIDFKTFKPCKHILFVYLKILSLPRDSKDIFQIAHLTKELHVIFAKTRRMLDPRVMASYRIRRRYRAYITGAACQKRRPIEGGDCAICYEKFDENDDNIVWCQKGCGNNLHKACYDQWKRTRSGIVTCVYCRDMWLEDSTKFSINKEGFVHFGNFGPI
ncbi:4517_t:CDS:2 [Funneliformis mosseae]|uniref:4517_t:CDS:1 n=1 Tax=Funneliformis mosseae TaxID=27381 RepID=A0A9N8YRL5_FUNMO|nr:4517_t:CDS:2 [Funneliformis mosseae]